MIWVYVIGGEGKTWSSTNASWASRGGEEKTLIHGRSTDYKVGFQIWALIDEEEEQEWNQLCGI